MPKIGNKVLSLSAMNSVWMWCSYIVGCHSCNAARGSSTGLSLVGPADVKAGKSFFYIMFVLFHLWPHWWNKVVSALTKLFSTLILLYKLRNYSIHWLLWINNNLCHSLQWYHCLLHFWIYNLWARLFCLIKCRQYLGTGESIIVFKGSFLGLRGFLTSDGLKKRTQKRTLKMKPKNHY